MRRMRRQRKKTKLFQWIIAFILIAVTCYSYIYVKHQEDLREHLISKQEKIDLINKKSNKKIIKYQEKQMYKHIILDEPSNKVPYPNIGSYLDYHKENKVWILVSLKKQRLYIYQGPHLIYTMYAYTNIFKTPIGLFEIEKNRGFNYYDEPEKYDFKSWLMFGNLGPNINQKYFIQSVPLSLNGSPIPYIMRLFGKSSNHNQFLNTNGAIWLTIPDSIWLCNNIPSKTLILIQGINNKNNSYSVIRNYYKQIEFNKKNKYRHI